MIHQDVIETRGREFLHTYSDKFYILQIETGIIYDDAYDIIPCVYTYEETEKPLPESSESV